MQHDKQHRGLAKQQKEGPRYTSPFVLPHEPPATASRGALTAASSPDPPKTDSDDVAVTFYHEASGEGAMQQGIYPAKKVY